MKAERGRRAFWRGRRAEWLCLWHLRLTGWRIVAYGRRSARGSGLGEIDILARRGAILAVIEVKARSSFEEAAAAIGRRQRERLARAAAAFLAGRPDLAGLDLRFDAMLVAPGHWPRRLADAWREAG